MPEPLTLYLAAPRGFCAGVDRAIRIVEMALEKWGAPVYVRHEIVHNRFVVDGLRAKGAVFVEELAECPPDRPVVFSAHGVPKAVPAEAEARRMLYVDATCPLVSKVHIEAERHHENGLQMVMIGHAGHPETVGTMGQLPPGEVPAGRDRQPMSRRSRRATPARLAFITQTTLSVDDTAEIVAALSARFPAIVGPRREDICYATTNRQEAVKAIAPKVDALLVIGAPNSSNSQRLVEVGRRAGCGYAQLVQRATDIDWRALEGVRAVGITAGASAPEVLVEEVIAAFRARYAVTERLVETATRARRVQGAAHPPRPGRLICRRALRLYRRRLLGQSRPRRLGRGARRPRRRGRAEGAAAQGRRGADHQQPHGADGGDRRARGARPPVGDHRRHRQRLPARRRHAAGSTAGSGTAGAPPTASR